MKTISIAERESVVPDAAASVVATDEPRRRLFTRDEYHRLADNGVIGPHGKLELIDGEIYCKVRPQTPLHFSTIRASTETLTKVFGPVQDVRYQAPLVISDYSEPEPDVMVLRQSWDSYSTTHPRANDVLLLIEVSDVTVRFDRTEKSKLYAKSGINDYWIINLQDRQLEVYRNPVAGSYSLLHVLKEGSSVAPLAAPAALIEIHDLLLSMNEPAQMRA